MLWSEAVSTLLSKVAVRKDAVHFLEAVDLEAQGGLIDDFPVIVKHEFMHLSLIKHKLEGGEYILPKDVDLDMQTLFKNAQIYNPQNTPPYLDSLSLAKYWEFNWAFISNDTTEDVDSVFPSITLHSPCVVTIPRIKLVALDLDGTLLNNHHTLTERTINVLRRLSDAGVIICLASGRSHASMWPYAEQLSLCQEVLPIVCYNGARGFKYTRVEGIVDRVREDVFATELPVESTKQLIAFAEQNGFLLQYYDVAAGDVYCVPKTDTHRQLMAKYRGFVTRDQVVVESYEEALEKGPAAKCLILDFNTNNVMNAAMDQLPHDLYNMFRGSPDPFFVEFLDPEASKGNGLSLVCSHLNIDMKHVVAFGDGENDKEMLFLSGMGIAMQNAKSEAKQNADIILEWTNGEDGVARQLEVMIEEGYFGECFIILNMENIFEIREYVDSKGAPLKQEVVDITKEMEHFAKAGGDKIEEMEALDEERQFIRELALMTEKLEGGVKTEVPNVLKRPAADIDEVSRPKDDFDFFDELQILDEEEAELAYIREQKKVSEDAYKAAQKQKAVNMANSLKGTSEPVKQPKQTVSAGSTGGWKAGFLSSGPAKKKTASPTTSSTSAPVTGVVSERVTEVSTKEVETKLSQVQLNSNTNTSNNTKQTIPTTESKLSSTSKQAALTSNIIGTPSTTTNTSNVVSNTENTTTNDTKKSVSFNAAQEAEKQAKAEYKLRHKEYHTTEVEEEPVENIFSQQKSFLHSSMSRGATGGMKPLPKIPRGETTKLAFDSVGGIKERIV